MVVLDTRKKGVPDNEKERVREGGMGERMKYEKGGTTNKKETKI